MWAGHGAGARSPHRTPRTHADRASPLPRLLAQLSETEAAFDEFWAKHQQKLQQCLQLRHFEQDFREVSGRSGGSWPWAQEAGEAAQIHPPLWAKLPRSLSTTRSCETQWDQTLKRVASESLPTAGSTLCCGRAPPCVPRGRVQEPSGRSLAQSASVLCLLARPRCTELRATVVLGSEAQGLWG